MPAPLMKKAQKVIPQGESMTELYGDAAYDFVENLSFLEDRDIAPYIAKNKRNRENPILRGDIFITEEGEIVSRNGMRLPYWGYEKKRKKYKFGCPLVTKGGSCLFRSLCWKTEYEPVFYLHEETPVMDRVKVIRNSPRFSNI